jgi:RHS repeat-associated core domain
MPVKKNLFFPITGTSPTNDGLVDYKNTNYAGNIIYETAKSGTAITNKTRILVDGGYIEGGVYHFYLTDHLGNNRVVAKADGTVIQKNHYYPFGTAFAENTVTEQGKQPYKYNGKELDTMHGLNMYDYSARYYDSNLGRFSSVDPLAEKYYSHSPYVYVGNNPIKRIDPTGMDWVHRVVDGVEEYYYDRDVCSQDDVLNKYGENGGVTHIASGSSISALGVQFTFFNDGSSNNEYGAVVDANGNLMADDKIIYGKDFTIFGTNIIAKMKNRAFHFEKSKKNANHIYNKET